MTPDTENRASVAAIVVTYRPGEADISRLSRLSGKALDLIVVDNTEQPCVFPDQLGGIQARTHVLHNRNVGGIAGALNRGLSKAESLGLSHVILLDQDSDISSGIIDAMVDLQVKQAAATGKSCLIGPNFFDRGSKTYGRCARLTRWSFETIQVSEPAGVGRLIPTSFLITSGTCFTVKDWKRIGPFNEDLFIDHVDTEYCLRASQAGCTLFLAEDLIIDHAVGQRRVGKFAGMTFKPTFHNPTRRYYIFRNGLLLMGRFGRRYPGFVVLCGLRLCHDLVGILVFEDRRLPKLRAVILGAWHAIRGKTGPLAQ